MHTGALIRFMRKSMVHIILQVWTHNAKVAVVDPTGDLVFAWGYVACHLTVVKTSLEYFLCVSMARSVSLA